ncbi:MAG: DNA mismatch repair endonuclease MutL [Bacteroidetes bacterium]|nr:DNA mismatch repair endonuclease MutL [Bacteroidota bacterium]
MTDIIHLLPDSVANQIAAGEVIQRPASAVKELIENAVDAGSTSIKLILKDAGKVLIQVIDNGKGMSETDARMSFERHATSKIQQAADLFAITTKGFRGEALASIAAIAQVELKTRRPEDEIGTRISIEGSELQIQESCSTPVGTSFSIKNLFFNVPARRNFLKSNPVETSHIIEEFQRIALAHPDIEFSIHHNGADLFQLPKSNLRQRIVNVFGANYNQRLVPVEEETFIVKITGFIGKPEFAKKTRGEQYFFVNNRFIKNGYLHHAIQNAYEQLLPKESHPSYFLFLSVDPKSIDINIHPTKTEIKFEDERAIYAILRSAVKKSLGQHNISPTIDFEQEASISLDGPPKDRIIEAPKIRVNPDYNPFKSQTSLDNARAFSGPSLTQKANLQNWEKLYESHEYASVHQAVSMDAVPKQETINPKWENDFSEVSKSLTYQLHGKYILSHIKTGFIIVDQQSAHERILYEKFIQNLERQSASSQQLLFPETLEFNASDTALVHLLLAELNALGFAIEAFGKNTFVVHGIPPIMKDTDSKHSLERILEEFKKNQSELKLTKSENLARSMAINAAVKSGKQLGNEEMKSIIDELFACKQPYSSPSGKPTLITFSLEDLEKRFKK